MAITKFETYNIFKNFTNVTKFGIIVDMPCYVKLHYCVQVGCLHK